MKKRDLFDSTTQTDSLAPALCHLPQVGTPNRESIRFPCSDPRPHAACHSSKLASLMNIRQQTLLPSSPKREERREGEEGCFLPGLQERGSRGRHQLQEAEGEESNVGLYCWNLVAEVSGLRPGPGCRKRGGVGRDLPPTDGWAQRGI